MPARRPAGREETEEGARGQERGDAPLVFPARHWPGRKGEAASARGGSNDCIWVGARRRIC